jgi:hypothetical protein
MNACFVAPVGVFWNVGPLELVCLAMGFLLIVIPAAIVTVVVATRRGKTESRPDNPNLLPCPDCGRFVSPLAVACPQCGRPLKPQQE